MYAKKTQKNHQYFFCSLVADVQPFPHTPLTVTNDGMTHWTPPAEIYVLCDMHLAFFPFDRQTCLFTFSSFSYEPSKLDLTLRDNVSVIDVSWYHASSEWDLVETEAKRLSEHFPCCDAPFVDVSFSLTIKRKAAVYRSSILLPLAIIQAVTVLVFWVPPDCREKVTLAIVNFVALTILCLQMSSTVPPMTDSHTPTIGKERILIRSFIPFFVF